MDSEKSYGVVAITSPSHGEGRGFNPHYDYFSTIFLLNIEYIVDKLDSLAGSDNDKKEVKLDKFLSEMLGDINNSLGGLNEFRVAFSDESMCIQLTDEQRVEDNTGAIAPAVIDVLGLQSLVQSYSFQSKLTPKIASMLIISAQATEGKNKQASTDASAIGKWNENVKDRIMPAKVDSTDPPTTPAAKVEQPTEATQGQSESPDDQLSRHIKGIYQLFKYSEEDVAAASKTLKEKLTALKANSEETAATGLIPLEMTIKMDGISGILVNQSFVIPPERLPLSYQTDSSNKTKFGFIVRKIENSIENNKWMTSISGQSLYLPKAVDATVKLLNTKITSVKYVTPTPPPTAPAETLDPTAQKKEAEKLSKISVPNSGKNITASFKVEQIIKDAGMRNIERVNFYVNKTQFVDFRSSSNVASSELGGGDITDPNAVSMSLTVPDLVPTQNYVYARVGVKIQGVEDMIFTPVQKIEL